MLLDLTCIFIAQSCTVEESCYVLYETAWFKPGDTKQGLLFRQQHNKSLLSITDYIVYQLLNTFFFLL
jgi:hypothetical protein